LRSRMLSVCTNFEEGYFTAPTVNPTTKRSTKKL
jgi:hypothetical protein